MSGIAVAIGGSALIGAGASMYGSSQSSKAAKKGPQFKIVEDPYKTKVSSPLSEFLASRIGKGLPRYGSVGSGSEGQTLYEPLDPKAYNTYKDFLNVSPGEWYTKGVQDPTMKAMREEIPNISENWAGGLRGSGRFSDVEDYMSDTASTLAEGRYKAELEIPQAQFAMAQSYSEMRSKEKALEYTDWMQSLPENNPILTQALNFLNADSGYNVVTYGGVGGGGIGTANAISSVANMLPMLMMFMNKGGGTTGTTTAPSFSSSGYDPSWGGLYGGR